MLDEFVTALIIVLIFVGSYLAIQKAYELPKPFVFPFSSDRNIYSQVNSTHSLKVIGCRNMSSGQTIGKNIRVERFPVLIKCGNKTEVGVAEYAFPEYS